MRLCRTAQLLSRRPGPNRATARLELNRGGVVEIASGHHAAYKLLRLGGSAFQGFVRDEYTTLPDICNRPLHMWLDLEWLYTDIRPPHFTPAPPLAAVRGALCATFLTDSNPEASSR